MCAQTQQINAGRTLAFPELQRSLQGFLVVMGSPLFLSQSAAGCEQQRSHICKWSHAGAEEIMGLGELNELEQKGLDVAISELTSSIEKGVKFAKDGSL